MHPALVIILILATALLTYWLQRGRFALQIRDLKMQLTELRENKMRNSNILKNHGSEDWEPLIREINHDIENQRKMLNIQEKKEANLRQQISDLSHDLRTPLTSLKGYLSLMRENADHTELLDLASKRTESLHHLVDSIYEIARYEDPSLHLNLTEQNPRVILEDQLLALYNEFQDSGLKLDMQLSTNRKVRLSRPELERVYQNLLKNALRYAHSYVMIEHGIADTGQVFTCFTNDLREEQAAELEENGLSSLFERFYKADSSRTSGSTGLGLYLAKLLAERMDADLKAELNHTASGFQIQFTLVHALN